MYNCIILQAKTIGPKRRTSMRLETIEKLNQLNQKFYDAETSDFDQTRQQAWTGWQIFWQEISSRLPSPLSVLDVGCGNGRFYKFLQQQQLKFDYTGIDQSHKLINIAQKNFKDINFNRQDLLSDWKSTLREKNFDLIVLFGVMHHIPGEQNRRQLVKDLASLLTPAGFLVISIWDFLQHQRFLQKLVDPIKLGINKNELENNDFLMNWGKDPVLLRYCHYLDKQEELDLLVDSNLKIIKNFYADGKTSNLNRYLVLKK